MPSGVYLVTPFAFGRDPPLPGSADHRDCRYSPIGDSPGNQGDASVAVEIFAGSSLRRPSRSSSSVLPELFCRSYFNGAKTAPRHRGSYWGKYRSRFAAEARGCCPSGFPRGFRQSPVPVPSPAGDYLPRPDMASLVSTAPVPMVSCQTSRLRRCGSAPVAMRVGVKSGEAAGGGAD